MTEHKLVIAEEQDTFYGYGGSPYLKTVYMPVCECGVKLSKHTYTNREPFEFRLLWVEHMVTLPKEDITISNITIHNPRPSRASSEIPKRYRRKE